MPPFVIGDAKMLAEILRRHAREEIRHVQVAHLMTVGPREARR
jgi:predicted metal-dependent hydrolase